MAGAGHIYRERVRREVKEEYRKQFQSACGSGNSNGQVTSTSAPGHGSVVLGSNLPGITGAGQAPDNIGASARGDGPSSVLSFQIPHTTAAIPAAWTRSLFCAFPSLPSSASIAKLSTSRNNI